MSKPKLTDWFVNGERPVRKGVYQQMCGLRTTIGYQRWSGKNWYAWNSTADAAARDQRIADLQKDHWRGLAHPPKAKP